MLDAAPLLLSAATIGVLHTALGPDHSLPFIALARARRWLGVAKQYTKTTVNMLATRIGANAGRTTRLRKFGSHAPWRLVSPLDNRGAQRGLSRVPKTLFPKVARNFQRIYISLTPPIGFLHLASRLSVSTRLQLLELWPVPSSPRTFIIST